MARRRHRWLNALATRDCWLGFHECSLVHIEVIGLSANREKYNDGRVSTSELHEDITMPYIFYAMLS